MYKRLFNYSKTNSFFLFGARGTGKSTLLSSLFSKNECYWIDLLLPSTEERYLMHPELLREEYLALPLIKRPTLIVIDEVQKLPKLLDVVHSMIEEFKVRFILTGSSARKLKQKGANLLAGRAFEYHLFPFTSIELGAHFDLQQALTFGLLPKIWNLTDDEDKKDFLRSYVQKYLKEEIQLEQLVRDLAPFRKFLEVAGQSNGEILNYSRLGRLSGVDYKSVERYYEILADTYLGFFLDGYDRSIRVRQIKSPKFYFFDTGVVRALNQELSLEPKPSTFSYGKLFESFLITECFKLNSLLKKDFKFSYLKTKEGVEIDLIIERPGTSTLLIEIKSSQKIIEDDYRSLVTLGADFKNSEKLVLSLDPSHRLVNDIEILPYKEGLEKIFSPD